MAKPKTAKKEFPNTGTINSIKDGNKQATDRIRGDLDIAGTKYKINGNRVLDSKNRLTLQFSLLEVNTDDIFGGSTVASENGVLKLSTTRSTEKSPHWKGKFSIGKQGYRLSGWVREHAEYGNFISLSVQTEEKYQEILAQYKDADKESESDETPADTEDPGF